MVLKMIRRSFLRSFLLQHPPKGVLQTNAIILGLSIFRDVRRSLGMMAAGVLVLVALLVGEAQSDAGGGLASLVTTPERRERTNHGVVEGHAPFAGWGVEGPEPSRETGLWVGSEAAPESADTAEAEQTATAEPAGETRCGAGGCLVATRYGDGRLKADGSHEIDFNGLPPGCRFGAADSVYQDGLYHSDDPTILAAPPSRCSEWPCGTRLRLCLVLEAEGDGVATQRCIEVTRVDSCPGCGANHADPSRSRRSPGSAAATPPSTRGWVKFAISSRGSQSRLSVSEGKGSTCSAEKRGTPLPELRRAPGK